MRIAVLIARGGLILAGCNIVQGIGKDANAGGEALERDGARK